MRRISLMALRERLEPKFLALIVAFASALWVFAAVVEDVVEGDSGVFDRAVMLALRTPGEPGMPLGPPWLTAVARDITALGSMSVIGLVVSATVLFLLLANRRRTACFVLMSSASGALATFLLKHAFDRPRPDLFPHGDYAVSASFPSGHAMLSALVYLTLGALVARLVEKRRLKLYILGVVLALSMLVGLSRVYLGVHWPTDVLAGWAAGAAWALAWWGLANYAPQKSGGGA